MQFPSQKKSDPKLPSEHPSHAFGRPSVSTVQAYFRPDVVTTCPDALQSSRRIQRSSTSVRTTWQYRSDASQCSTNKRISFAYTDMGRQLQPSRCQVYTVRTLFFIGQGVEKNCNRPDVRATPSGCQSLLWKLLATEVQPSGHQGNIVQMQPYSGKKISALWKAGCIVHHSNAAQIKPNQS